MRRSTRVRSSGKSPSLARGPTRGGTSRRGAGFSEVTGVRIAQVSPWFSPHFGGVESHVRSLSRELARRGHEVTVVTSQHDRTLSAEETVDGFRVVRVRPRFIFMQTPITPRMRGSLRALSADVVHAHSPPPLASHYAGAVASERGIPYVVTYHCDVELPSAFGSVVESIYRRSLGADTLRNANQVIVTTRTYAATSRAIWRYNPSVIPNAVDHRRFRPDVDGSAVRAKLRIPPEVPIVLLVGRIVPHKGVEHFVEAARYVPDARFLVAGGGSSLDAMKRLALSMGVADRVRFLGRISVDRLPEVYAACDVFVLPSVSRLEAFGIVALEAMSTGKPVIVADIPGVREMIEDGRDGLLADPVNPRDLAEKIRRLLSDPKARRTMGARGREKVLESFSIERVTDRIEAVYRAILDGSEATTARP
ncbi:MAG: glycosyltransferase family 4 protein [Methanobacteriota archaeon]|nr:MAG: glycosyltransferase family 4 protein [Euryarchaeota archaeon]